MNPCRGQPRIESALNESGRDCGRRAATALANSAAFLRRAAKAAEPPPGA